MSANELFGRHMDLTPLRSRRRGLVRCPFHQDRTASLSVDLDAGVFHCFGCGKKGGVQKFAELVGERRPARREYSRRALGELDHARRGVLEDARRQPWAQEWVQHVYFCADFLRLARRKVHSLRDLVTRLGSTAAEREEEWQILDRAARMEQLVWAVEAELDAVLAEGRP